MRGTTPRPAELVIRGQTMQRLLVLPAVTAGMLASVPATAGADIYSVFSCRDPLGTPNAAAGWTSARSGSGIALNTCQLGGQLTAMLPDAAPAGDASAMWRFDAPLGTRVVRIIARRTTTGLRKSTQASDLKYVLDTDTAVLEDCAPSASSSCVADLVDVVDKQGLNGALARFRAQCTNAGDVCSGPLRVDVAQVAVGLEDVAAPTVGKVVLVDDGDRSGTLRVRYDAADVGGGVYRSVVKVDGKPAQTIPIGAAPCTDVLESDADPYQFNVPVPCPLVATAAQARVHVRSLAAGPHGVEIAVEDAAGNETAVYGPVEFPRLNAVTGSSIPVAQALRARLRAWFVKAPNRGRRYTSRLGTRVVTRGVLRTRSGRGVQGARIDVYHIRDGKRKLLKTGLKTRERGRLTLILPMDVDTRQIEFAYRALRPGPITSRQRLTLKVLTRGGRVYHRP